MPRRLPPTGRAPPCPAIAPAVISPAATDRTAAPPVRGLRRLRDREPPVLKLIAEIETEQRIERLFVVAFDHIDRALLVTDIESEVPEVVTDAQRHAEVVRVAILLVADLVLVAAVVEPLAHEETRLHAYMHVQPLDEVDLGRDRDIEVSHVQVHDIVDLLAFDIIDVHARPRTRVEQFGLHGEESPHPVASEDAAVGAHQRIAALAEQVRDKRLEGISDIRDESDRNGMRVVIELKRDANAQVVLNRLFAQTQLQTTFAINMLALVQNQRQPKILSLRHIIDEYLKFQEEIIVRRTRYDLKKAEERAHLLEGLLVAQDNIDEVIHIIRSSYDNAKENLMTRFSLDEVQAQAILDMRLKALQGLDREKLQTEYKELEEKIAYFLRILNDENLVKSILKEELTSIADKYGDDRKTEIQDVEDELDIEDLIEEEQCVFTLTENGYIKRTPVSEYAAQSKGGMGKKGITTREEDTVVDVFTASTHDYILFFTDTGKVYRKKGYQIPESGKTAKGTNIVNILQVETGERVQAMLHFREQSEDELYLFMTTRNGTVKRLEVSALKNLRNNGIRALTLDEGDELISVVETRGHDRMLIATHDGQAVCFDETDVRAMGRIAVGVRGIRLRDGDYVVGAARADADKTVLSITERGFGKRTPVEEYRITNRGGLGIRNYMVTEKTGPIVGIKVVDGTEDLLLVTAAGILIRTPVENIRVAGRATQGVIIMRFKEEGDRVISMALADHEEKADAPEETV